MIMHLGQHFVAGSKCESIHKYENGVSVKISMEKLKKNFMARVEFHPPPLPKNNEGW